MTKIFKNVRVLLCALALSASVHGAMAAQEKAVPTPTPRPTLKPTPTPTPKPAPYTGRRLTLVTETGAFKGEFKSINEAYAAAQGNSYNQTLKKGSEIIVMNARCADGRFGDKVTFSMHRMNDKIDTIVKSYLDYRKANPNLLDSKQRERALIDEIVKILAISKFPRTTVKTLKDDEDDEDAGVECEPIPVALALSTSEVLRLEVDDAQSPLVGPKINDGFLHDGFVQSSALMRSNMAKERAFWEKFDSNRFADVQDALNASLLFAGTKVLIFNGTTFSIYRIGKFERDYKASNAQFDVFKTTPLRKGLKIVAVVSGADVIKISDPNVR